MTDDEKKPILPRIQIDRDVYTQEMLVKESGFEARDKSLLYAYREFKRQCKLLKFIKSLFPIVEWLPKYSVKDYLVGDIMSGCTVAVMHIPQGMAYGILAGLTPNVGLYMAFFPVLAYLIFGSSRHVSIGTFAVMSLMTLKVVNTYATFDNSTMPASPNTPQYTPLEVATATAIMVGIIHLIMAIFCLGTLANLLCEPLVNGFTTGAAVHVVASQLKDVFGVELKRHRGPLKLVYTLIDVFRFIPETNIAALVFTIAIMTFMVIMNEVVKPYMAKKTRFPIPAELMAVMGGTMISRYAEVGPKFNVTLVGDIPTGLPMPSFPPVSLLTLVWMDAVVIAVVSYSVDISMSFLFAKKHSYQISPNQELVALGVCNIVGGAFSCIPVACSLARSLIQEQTGGKTQIASGISASLILMVLLWIGPFFETLPKCVLAGIIIVSLKGMFMQAKKVKKFAKEGKGILMLWVCTFVGVVLVDIDYGLIFGFVLSVICLYLKGWKASYSLVGNVPGTELYVNLNNHKNAVEVQDTKIYRYFGSINFATQTSYKKNLYELLKLDDENVPKAVVVADTESPTLSERSLLTPFKVVILDLHAVNHIDVPGCVVLTEIVSEMKEIGVRVFLANPSVRVYEAIMHGMSLGEGPFEIFPTVHDAVTYSKQWRAA